ncbi:MAG: RNA methyltransferase [Cytophagales bacterium]|nr:RNA methyltransferase [Bernardetiaceae bacterium]MDW8205682.1 RNA methyltransferase [Cytophagales bacterium]
MAISRKWFKLCRLLHQKKHRQAEQLFLVEGAKSVGELLAHGAANGFRVVALLATEAFIATQLPTGKTHFLLETATAEELEQAGTIESNNAAIAIVQMPPQKPFTPNGEWLLALSDIRDPGNLGTIIRIADWYGIRHIVCSPTTAEWYNPKVIAASMGSFLRVKPFYTDLRLFFSACNLPVYGALLNGSNIHQFQPTMPGIILIGNESHGIANDLLPFVTHALTIPRIGKAESLNAGIATAIFCDNLIGRTQ